MVTNIQRSENNNDICQFEIAIELQIIGVLKWATVI